MLAYSKRVRRSIAYSIRNGCRGPTRLSSLALAVRLGNEAVRPLPSLLPILCPTSYVPPPSRSPLMPQTSAMAAASSSFEAIFQAAITSYQKQTKNDLCAHPLASQLQDCDSTNAILAILHDQVQQFDKSHSSDERLTKWLGPTVNVLNAFSATISGGVSLVGLDSWPSVSFGHIFCRYFHLRT